METAEDIQKLIELPIYDKDGVRKAIHYDNSDKKIDVLLKHQANVKHSETLNSERLRMQNKTQTYNMF